MRTFADQIENHVTYLKRYAMFLTRDPVRADDLAQECIAHAMSKRDLYRDGTNLRAWLSTIMRNLYISDCRRESRWGVPVELEDAPASMVTRPNQTGRVMLRAVARALRTIPRKQREPLMLFGVHELSYEEISDRLSVPVGTVKSRISRARETLRAELQETGNESVLQQAA